LAKPSALSCDASTNPDTHGSWVRPFLSAAKRLASDCMNHVTQFVDYPIVDDVVRCRDDGLIEPEAVTLDFNLITFLYK